MATPDPAPIIPDRAEFIDALNLMRKGRVMVHIGQSDHGWAIDGCTVRYSVPALTGFGLVAPFENPHGFRGVEYYRLTDRGRAFADQACAAWRRRSLWERMLVRLVG